MLIVLSLAIICLAAIFIIGYPINSLVSRKFITEQSLPVWTNCALNLIFGFAVLALSASISYSFFGIDSYPIVALLLIFIAPLILISIGSRPKRFKLRLNPSDWVIAVPILFSIYLSRTQWSGLTGPQIHAGNGPDTSQNLMAAQSARSLGSTWQGQGQNLKDRLDTDTLREAVQYVFTLPSFREQAGFDYLVFGTRWSLTIFYSQVLRFFGDSAILWETGFVLLFSLISTAVISFGIVSLFTSATKWRLIASIVCVANSGFLLQFFNGGLSQAFGTIGMLGIYLSLVLIFRDKDLNAQARALVFAVSTASWLILLTTYIDAAFVLIFFLIILILVATLFNRSLAFQIISYFIPSGIISILLSPVLSYSTVTILDLRGQSASNTGLNNPIWAYPSDLFGFGSGFVSSGNSRGMFSVVLAIVLSLALVSFTLLRFRKSDYSFLLSAALITLLAGFIASKFLSESNYIYHKIGVYLAPGIVFFILGKLLIKQDSRTKIGSIKNHKSSHLIITVLTFVAVISAVDTSTKLEKQGSTIANETSGLLDDKEVQIKLSSFNYLAPYVLSGNYLGVMADVHWVSKSPNDIDLRGRMGNEMRLICYQGDPNCKPTTTMIPDPEIEKFGLLQFASPISTLEFSELDISARYRVNFEVFGMKEFPIPQKFLGGNPYLNR